MCYKFPMKLLRHSISDWLFNTKSRVLKSDWLILENNKKATLSIMCPIDMYWLHITILPHSVHLVKIC